MKCQLCVKKKAVISGLCKECGKIMAEKMKKWDKEGEALDAQGKL